MKKLFDLALNKAVIFFFIIVILILITLSIVL